MNFVLLRGPASDVCQGNHSCSSRLSVHFFSESLIVLSFTFRSVIHFDVTFSSVFFYFVCGYPILVPLVRETIFLYELPCLLCQKSIAQNPIYLILDSLLCQVFY